MIIQQQTILFLEKENHFTVEKNHRMELNNTYPGWKVINSIIKTAEYFWNGVFYLSVNLIKGKFGLRSLVGLEKFNTDIDFDTKTGELTPKLVNMTWFGRIRRLWKNIAKSIETFESLPDDGIFGKTFSRMLNRLWNYGVVGLVGTPLCFIGHPLLVIINTVISGLGLLASPVWAPVIGLFRVFR